MRSFNQEFDEFKLLVESPEDFQSQGKLTVESPDVVTFMYFIKKGAVVYGDVGSELYHFNLIRYVGVGDTGLIKQNVNVVGNSDLMKDDIKPDSTIMGRVWVNHNVMSIWDYMGDYFENINLEKHIQRMGNLMGIDFSNYDIEISQAEGDKIKDTKLIKRDK